MLLCAALPQKLGNDGMIVYVYSSSAVPPPTVTLTVLSSAPHAVGGTFTVQCQAVVSHHVNTPVTIKFTWRKTRGQLTTDSDTRVTISTVALVSSHTYRSNLTLTDLSIATDSNQNYSCQASVMSTLASAYILNSSIVTSNAYLLKVHGTCSMLVCLTITYKL